MEVISIVCPECCGGGDTCPGRCHDDTKYLSTSYVYSGLKEDCPAAKEHGVCSLCTGNGFLSDLSKVPEGTRIIIDHNV